MSDNDRDNLYAKDVIVDSDPERERGILTPHDRAFLRSDTDEGVREGMSTAAKRQKRHKIRERFQNALIDIQYMLLLETGDLNRVLRKGFDEEERDRIERTVFSAIYHFIRADSDRDRFFGLLDEKVMDEIVGNRARKHGVYTPVRIERDIDIPPVDECPTLKEVQQRLDDGEEFPPLAHGALASANMHPYYDEYLAEEADDHGEE